MHEGFDYDLYNIDNNNTELTLVSDPILRYSSHLGRSFQLVVVRLVTTSDVLMFYVFRFYSKFHVFIMLLHSSGYGIYIYI